MSISVIQATFPKPTSKSWCLLRLPASVDSHGQATAYVLAWPEKNGYLGQKGGSESH